MWRGLCDDFDEVSTGVVFPHGGPQCAVPYSVKRLFEVNEDVTQILLVLAMFFAQGSQIEDLFCCTSSCPEIGLFFCDHGLWPWFQPVDKHFQHDFAGVAYEAYDAVVLALLQIPLFW